MKKFKSYFLLLFEGLRTFAKASKWGTFILVILVPIEALVPTGIIFSIQKVTTELTKGSAFSMSWGIFWAVLLLISNIIPPATTAISGYLTDVLIANINQKLIEKSSEIKNLEVFEDAEFYNDVETVRSELSWRPVNLIVFTLSNVRYIISLLSLLILLFNYTWWLPLAIIIVLVPQSLIHYRIQQEAFETLVTRRPEARKMNYLLEIALNRDYAKEARLFNVFNFLKKRYWTLFYSVHKEENRVRLRQFGIALAFIIVSSLVSAFSFIYLIFQVRSGTLSIGIIVGFASSLVAAISASNGLVEESDLLYDTLMWLEKYLKLMKRSFDKSGNIKISEINQIKLENIMFFYPNEKRASLCGISLEIKKVEKIAIVGQNGSGKSTLLKLLADLFVPTKGKILINNVDLREIKQELYWEKVAPVFQDFSKFKFSIGDSISFGKMGEVEKALDFSGLAEFTSEIQLGKEFAGTDLSGGQWQKLAIARAFYKENVELYLFDGANSALDVQSEKQLYRKLMELASGKTVIWITHRMTSVKLADKVLYLKNGRVLGFDSHENLLKNNDYASLYQEQFDD
ncbi:ABC transporter ATP-binding protein/permease [Lactococcus cremoris]|uniref:ATP-binding cassette domain-containing protein n=1 Tax=Lactococcus lactis subsp. cremoris TaxID=1359 RepID=UPI001E3C9948|nr:ABC transporter ATP-binding protein [Lactococcus cremoris]MCD6631522.1 ABC transporter ATP-binding protein/permease [Lactococcus cremoris]